MDNKNTTSFGKEGVFAAGVGAEGTYVEMPYSGIRTFLRRRTTLDLAGVDMAVFGIPFDLATAGRSGSRMGPSALREASTHLAWGAVWPWGFDPFDRLSVVDCGDVPFQRGQSAQMYDSVTEFVREIVPTGVQTIMLGGDHSSTYPLLKAHAERHGPLSLIQFDAHRDTQESEHLDHGTFVHHAIKDGLIDPKRSVQVGIRTFYEDNDDITVLYRDWIHRNGLNAMQDRIKDVVGDRPAYLSIDIDSLDPAYAPGTGTPVIDGLAPHDILTFLRNSNTINFVGMDLVEVAPAYDHAEITALAGASLVLEYICSIAAKSEV
tara:strand:- start:5494 stop:6453 length:960 start_codon:yes stop_codon:yes gene_type:complete